MTRKRAGILSNAALVGTATMASRITGFIRDIFLAALLGAGPLAEIFVIAFRLPNLFRRLFAEGAFNAAFVPLFSKRLQEDGQAAALAFAGQIFSVLLAALAMFTLLAEIFMPALVLALAQGFAGDAEKFDLAVHYARISFPYLIFMSLMALFAAMLNAVNRFLAAAVAPVLLNLVLIGAMALAVMDLAVMDNGGSISATSDGRVLDYVIYAVTLAGLVQFLFVFIAAWRAGLRTPLAAPVLSDDVRKVWRLAVPGILAAGIGQINLLVGTSIATGQAGAAAWLYYADRLYQLPMGVIGVALAVALLPELSRRLADGQDTRARDAQNIAVLAAGGLTLPAAVGLLVLAEPIVTLLFERGAFTAADSAVTARLIGVFAFGLPAFVFIKALQPSFFARQDTRAPLIDGAIGVGVNIALSLSLFPSYGAPAIAFATVAAGWVTLSLMLVRMARRGIYHMSFDVLRRLAGQMAAAVLMGFVLAYFVSFLAAAQRIEPLGTLTFSLWLGGLIVSGALIYAIAAILLGGVRRSDIALLRGAG
ncbi:MAG: murein biosynthesis integral membrane protein MurJ [Alphaproteobacteria bacterium]|nr:murein biosynthesis integral membrane protein MurJ [Alphaproteobacteria bacterium]